MAMKPKQFVTENLERVLKLLNPRAILYECARGAYFLKVIRCQILWLFHMKHSQLRIRPYNGCVRGKADPSHQFTC